MANHQDLANFIWQIADLLRGPYRPPQYEQVMLPILNNAAGGGKNLGFHNRPNRIDNIQTWLSIPG